MQESRIGKNTRIFLVSLLILLLVLIRLFESDIFYDPFIGYFKFEFSNKPYPEFNLWKLVFSLKMRYVLNSIISVVMIYVIFEDKSMVKIASVLMLIFLIVLLLAFIILLTFFDQNHAMLLFYVRRFIVQPLFLILFIPAFYYQKKNS